MQSYSLDISPKTLLFFYFPVCYVLLIFNHRHLDWVLKDYCVLGITVFFQHSQNSCFFFFLFNLTTAHMIGDKFVCHKPNKKRLLISRFNCIKKVFNFIPTNTLILWIFQLWLIFSIKLADDLKAELAKLS